MPKVSVIIPVYNVEKYLRQCLDSVINQTLTDIEIICVDDGSTDSSLAILEEYASKDDRIKILKQQNAGAGVARNTGLTIAKGEYLYFFDSDDFLELNALEKLYQQAICVSADICIFKFKDYDSLNDDYSSVESSLRLNLIPENKMLFSVKDVPKDIFQVCAYNVWTKLYNRIFIIQNNIKFQNLRTCNDVYFNIMTLAIADKITYCDEFLINYRRDAINNLSSTRGNQAQNIIYAYKEIYKELKKRRIFSKLKNSLYEASVRNFRYELINSESNNREDLLKQILLFLPSKYIINNLIDFYESKSYCNSLIIKLKLNNKSYCIYNTKGFVDSVFSVKNSRDKKHKILTILGIKFSFRRKKYA